MWLMSDCDHFLFRSLRCLCRKILTLHAFESDWPAYLMTISHLQSSATWKFLDSNLSLCGCCNVFYPFFVLFCFFNNIERDSIKDAELFRFASYKLIFRLYGFSVLRLYKSINFVFCIWKKNPPAHQLKFPAM